MKVTNEMLKNVKKGQSYSIAPSEILVDRELNPRSEYGEGDDWTSFKESIKDRGIEQNLKAYFDADKKEFHLVHGFRRMKAVQELIAEGHDIPLVPFDIVENNKEDAIIGHFVLNSGKPLTDAEMAEGLKRLKTHSGEENVAELARKVGIPYQKAHNLLNFAVSAGAQLKKAVASGEISFSVANKIAHAGNITEQNRLLKEGKEKSSTAGKSKVRTQHISKINTEKVNLETKIGNLMAEADKSEDLDKEAFNMFVAVIKALKAGTPTADILPLFNLQVA
jgi:hypothetical protein